LWLLANLLLLAQSHLYPLLVPFQSYLPFLTGKESGIKRGDRSRPLLK